LTFRRTLPLLILTLLILTLLAYAPSGASGENRVALVVDFGDGAVETRCVSFAEEEITGYEVLERSGLTVETDFQAGGAAVCRIDNTGCPADDCFCSCRGGDDCVYWSYWHLNAGAWQYSMGGSGQYTVSDGDVEGWVWGLGSVTQASPPPLVTFGEVCADPAGASNTPTPSTTPIIIRTATPVQSNPTLPPTAVTATVQTGTPAQEGATATATTGTASVITMTATLDAGATAQATPIAPATIAPTQAIAIETANVSGGSESAVPVTVPQEAPGAATPAEEVALSTPGPSPTPVGADAIALSSSLIEENATPPAMAALSVVAIVGAHVPAGSDVADVPADQSRETVHWASYAGFAGLVLLLGALALIVYRRKGMS
jgi:hypothetical protein